MTIQDPNYFDSRELKITQISFRLAGRTKFEGHLKHSHRNWSMSFLAEDTDLVTIKIKNKTSRKAITS